jgi:hypothetical protein
VDQRDCARRSRRQRPCHPEFCSRINLSRFGTSLSPVCASPSSLSSLLGVPSFSSPSVRLCFCFALCDRCFHFIDAHHADYPSIVQKLDTNTLLPLDVPLYYPNALSFDPRMAPYSPQPFYQAGEWFKFISSTGEVRFPLTKTVTSALVSWTRNGPWLPWMKQVRLPFLWLLSPAPSFAFFFCSFLPSFRSIVLRKTFRFSPPLSKIGKRSWIPHLLITRKQGRQLDGLPRVRSCW